MRNHALLLFFPVLALACSSDPPATSPDASADATTDANGGGDATADAKDSATVDAAGDVGTADGGDCSTLTGSACQTCCRTQFSAGLAKFKTIVVDCVCKSSCKSTCSGGICATDPQVDNQACSTCIGSDAGGCASTLDACQKDKDCLDFAGCSKNCN